MPLSARFYVFSRPPPVSIPHIVRPPSSVRQKASNPPTSADQCLLLFSFPSVPYAGLHPPPTCVVGGTWLGCGWGDKGDGAPRDGLESVVLSAGITQDKQVRAYIQRRRSISLLILVVPVSLSAPPSPFPRTTVLVPLHSLQTGEYFRGRSPLPCSAGSGKQKRTLVGRSRRVGSFPTDGRWGTDDGGVG